MFYTAVIKQATDTDGTPCFFDTYSETALGPLPEAGSHLKDTHDAAKG